MSDSEKPTAPAPPTGEVASAGQVASAGRVVSRARAKDHSPWNWLLFLPIVVPLITPLFNADSPRLLGFPVFYWLQLAFILLGVGTTTVVYQMTKKRG